MFLVVFLTGCSQGPEHRETPDLWSPEVLFELPPGAFFEGIAVNGDGQVFLNERTEHVVYRYEVGEPVAAWSRPAKGIELAGLAADAGGRLFASGRGHDGVQAIFLVTEAGAQTVARVPDAVFLNGVTFLTDRMLIAAESFLGVADGSSLGRIFSIDVETGLVEVFLEHELLGRNDESNAAYPAANGIKVFEEWLFVTNSERAAVLRVPLSGELQAGTPEVFAAGVTGDDFAVAEDGTLFVTTHPMNTLVRVSLDGTLERVAGAGHGMVGSTAAAFGRTEADASSLYVVTNGGSYIPPPTGVETAKFLRVLTDTRFYEPSPHR